MEAESCSRGTLEVPLLWVRYKGSKADYDKSAQGQSQRNHSSFILKRKTKPQACEKIKLEHLSLSKKARTDQEEKGSLTRRFEPSSTIVTSIITLKQMRLNP